MKTKYTKLMMARVSGMTLSYFLTEAQVEIDGRPRLRYGAAVETQGGDRAEVTDMYSEKAPAEEFISKLRRCLVTPVTLKDVAYDELCSG